MSTFTRLATRRQRRHPDANSISHKTDAAEAAAHRSVSFVPVPTPAQEPYEPWPFASHAKTFDGVTWTPTEAEGLADYLEDQHKRRGYFVDQVKRRGHADRVPMRRKVRTPLENHTVALSPWAAAYFRNECNLGHNPIGELAQIRDRFIAAALLRFESKRFVLAYAFHADSRIPHFDVLSSRYQDGKRIGPVGTGLVGAWCVGVDRQVRCGAVVSLRKAGQFERDVAAFRRRHGQDAVPFDVSLARDLDAATDEVLGEKLEAFKADYRDTVPVTEAANDAAALAALDAAREKFLSPQPPTLSQEISR